MSFKDTIKATLSLNLQDKPEKAVVDLLKTKITESINMSVIPIYVVQEFDETYTEEQVNTLLMLVKTNINVDVNIVDTNKIYCKLSNFLI
jgi:hypothetical protein